MTSSKSKSTILKTILSMKLIPAESQANTTEKALTVENMVPIIEPKK